MRVKRTGTGPAVAIVVALTVAGASAGAAATTSQRATFAVSDSYRVGSWPTSVVVGDFSGDGRQDVVSAPASTTTRPTTTTVPLPPDGYWWL